MSLATRLAAVHRRLDALQHPFYQRWSEGTLTSGELADYAGQYRHAVVALADASQAAAEAAPPELREGLQAHADEERAHVMVWEGFTNAVGGSVTANADGETRECAQAWAGTAQRPFVLTLAALHAIESTQPEIAKTKRSGLVERYGVEPGAGTAYFDLHATRDVEHAAEAWSLLERFAGPDDEDAIVAETERVLSGYLTLLDGVSHAETA